MPTQVVLPSVSLAAVLHGTAFTVLVETPSAPIVSRPTSGPTRVGPSDASPTVDVDDGAAAAGGIAVESPGACCASAGEAKIIRTAVTTILRM
jgi:hypothetical protein